jgi:hypothetical protein
LLISVAVKNRERVGPSSDVEGVARPTGRVVGLVEDV